MAKKSKKNKRTKKGGRVTPKGTQPAGFVAKGESDCCSSCDPEPTATQTIPAVPGLALPIQN